MNEEAQELPVPRVENWRALYETGARARCVKDDPPMHGFGKPIKAGDVVEVGGVCWSGTKYQIAVNAECAFYDLEGFFEPVLSEEKKT